MVGGMGTLLGPILGIALLWLLPETLKGRQAIKQLRAGTQIAQAGILLVVLAFAPGGLVGAGLALWHKARRRWGWGTDLPPLPPSLKGEGSRAEERLAAWPARRYRPAGPAEADGQALLAVEGVTRRFGGVTALDKVDLTVRPAGLRAVIGPNGSGKTTLLNVVCGYYPAEAGTIHFRGRRIDRLSPSRIAKLGIARTFQTPKLVKDLSVRENVKLGMYAQGSASAVEAGFLLPRSLAEERQAREQAGAILAGVGLWGRRDERVANLSHGHLRLVEIARALLAEPDLLLLDEPAAGLHHQEVRELEAVLGRILDNGTAILLVEHNVGLVMRVAEGVTVLLVEQLVHLALPLADRGYVLETGRIAIAGTRQELEQNPRVIDAYLGAAV